MRVFRINLSHIQLWIALPSVPAMFFRGLHEKPDMVKIGFSEHAVAYRKREATPSKSSAAGSSKKSSSMMGKSLNRSRTGGSTDHRS